MDILLHTACITGRPIIFNGRCAAIPQDVVNIFLREIDVMIFSNFTVYYISYLDQVFTNGDFPESMSIDINKADEENSAVDALKRTRATIIFL
jgi:hypothetical protein